jgi:hypothetical protein
MQTHISPICPLRLEEGIEIEGCTCKDSSPLAWTDGKERFTAGVGHGRSPRLPTSVGW